MSNCFLENFSQPPNVPPQLGFNLPEKAAAKGGVEGFRDLLLLPVLQSLGGLVGFGQEQGAGAVGRLWSLDKNGS